MLPSTVLPITLMACWFPPQYTSLCPNFLAFMYSTISLPPFFFRVSPTDQASSSLINCTAGLWIPLGSLSLPDPKYALIQTLFLHLPFYLFPLRALSCSCFYLFLSLLIYCLCLPLECRLLEDRNPGLSHSHLYTQKLAVKTLSKYF